MTRKFEIGQKVKATIDMFQDLREDGLGHWRVAKKGDILVIRELSQYRDNSYAVSHENVTNSAFMADDTELEALDSGTE